MRQLTRIVILNYISNYIGQNLKNQSHKILRLWGDQCEYILAHRFRRGQQILCHYSKLWEERALKELLYRFRKQVIILYFINSILNMNLIYMIHIFPFHVT